MNTTDIAAKTRKSDGEFVGVRPDGREDILAKWPLRPIADTEIAAAALADPDAQPLAPENFGSKAASRRTRIRSAIGPILKRIGPLF